MEFGILYDIFFTVFPDFGVKVGFLTEMTENSLKFLPRSYGALKDIHGK